MTPEQQQRIEQIRERHEHNKSAVNDREQPIPKYLTTAYSDIDFLLSLVKSQEAGRDEPDDVQSIRARAYNEIPFSADVYRFDVRRLLHLYPQLRDQAATSMRSDCVEAIRSLRHKSEPDDSRWNAALYHAEKALESVSIQEQK